VSFDVWTSVWDFVAMTSRRRVTVEVASFRRLPDAKKARSFVAIKMFSNRFRKPPYETTVPFANPVAASQEVSSTAYELTSLRTGERSANARATLSRPKTLTIENPKAVGRLSAAALAADVCHVFKSWHGGVRPRGILNHGLMRAKRRSRAPG